mmetsp:Transcript_21107/g.40900  ORF Transcript_21107/g.40900 Transcript_21107/m.40900 type:complete len:121 (+) Transcript_21107:3365-3727(+)
MLKRQYAICRYLLRRVHPVRIEVLFFFFVPGDFSLSAVCWCVPWKTKENTLIENEKDKDFALAALRKECKLNCLGEVQECLGLQIEKDSRGCHSICQEKHTKRMCEKFNILPSQNMDRCS